MKLHELDAWMRARLDFDTFQKTDPGLNGIQVGRGDAEIAKVAFAVDACQESFMRAADWGADALVVHHGLFWGGQAAITGTHYDRIAFLCEKRLALYAMHLPLDAQPEFGNNAALAQELGLVDLQPFGAYRGAKIGWKGRLEASLTIEEVVIRLFGDHRATLARLPFGPADIRTVGIVSGGAADEAIQAIDEGLDLFVTGDASHEVYHRCLEAKINVIFGGHYQTEIWGVSRLAKRLAAETGLATRFIDVPTGL